MPHYPQHSLPGALHVAEPQTPEPSNDDRRWKPLLTRLGHIDGWLGALNATAALTAILGFAVYIFEAPDRERARRVEESQLRATSFALLDRARRADESLSDCSNQTRFEFDGEFDGVVTQACRRVAAGYGRAFGQEAALEDNFRLSRDAATVDVSRLSFRAADLSNRAIGTLTAYETSFYSSQMDHLTIRTLKAKALTVFATSLQGACINASAESTVLYAVNLRGAVWNVSWGAGNIALHSNLRNALYSPGEMSVTISSDARGSWMGAAEDSQRPPAARRCRRPFARAGLEQDGSDLAAGERLADGVHNVWVAAPAWQSSNAPDGRTVPNAQLYSFIGWTDLRGAHLNMPPETVFWRVCADETTTGTPIPGEAIDCKYRGEDVAPAKRQAYLKTLEDRLRLVDGDDLAFLAWRGSGREVWLRLSRFGVSRWSERAPS